ncbi:hypothetical protein CLV91_0296 [Maribacter vaceletii]|uniref:Glycosyl hydrolase family 76 n=1 Tax=Maribacter vaceletii TaxID=1206816 RepID=A0A495EBZ4_9FLAO|nr:hypothetical protein [Maribacter vaceletii]RKR14221.1 hypothetical protein CLV91_0296 [Maribacter vaceletii]
MGKFNLFLICISLVVTSCSKEEVIFEEIAKDKLTPEIIPIEEPNVINLSAAASKTNTWVSNMQQANGLLESAENTNFVSLYDNSLAALVYIKEGEIKKAEKIFNFFNGKLNAELLHGTGGFYQFRNNKGEQGSRTWMGDNAWLLIALNHYHEATQTQKYSAMANALEQWLRSLQKEDGSLIGGYNEDGTEIPKVTEGIITAFNAVPGYDNFHTNILSFLKLNRWDSSEKLVTAWPENPDYKYALDLHGLSIGIFPDFPIEALTKLDRYKNTQINTTNGELITGYSFDEDKDVIWLEGTAQILVAFQQKNKDKEANDIIKNLEKTFITSTSLEGAQGIPYTTNHGTTYGAGLLWDHADLTPAISSSAWYLFSQLKFSPFTLGNNKNIPEADKFWKTN